MARYHPKIHFYINRADIQYLYYIIYSILFVEFHSCYSHCFRSVEDCCAELRFELGPAVQQADALVFKTRRTLMRELCFAKSRSGSVIQCTDPRIRIRIKTSRIRNTGKESFKGLVAPYHPFLFIFTLIEQTYSIPEFHSCYPHCFSSIEGWGAEPRFELRAVPYRKPTRYYLSHAAP
jgi:hypothetical protein